MSFADFHFIRPWWLLALLPALVILVWLAKNKYSRGDWAAVCDVELLPYILQETPVQTGNGGLIAGGIAALLAILALAGPTWERLPSPAYRNDSALVIALDLSKSMDATDIKPSRLSRARYKIADILKLRKDGQTALLVYGGDAFTVTPLTTDVATINSQLEALTTDIMPSPGSNAAAALKKAVDLLYQAGLAGGHILLVTDGVDADSAERAGEILGDYRLSILALGSEDGAPIPMPGGSGFIKDASGNIVIARLDSAALMALADSGHGQFLTVTANDDDITRLAGLFNKVLGNDKEEQSDLLLQQWDEKGPWLALLVLPWAALRFRKGLLSLGLLCLLPMPNDAMAFDWQSLWQNPDQRGKQAFEQQQFDRAAEQFDNPSWRAAAQYRAGQYQQAAETLKNDNTADGHYNRGNALAKAGRLQEALQAYSQALKLDPDHADAKFNKALVEKQLQDQQQQDKDQQSSDQSSKDQNKQDQQSQQADSKPQDSQQQDGQKKPDTNGRDQQKQDDQPKEQQPSENNDKQEEADRAQDKPEPEQRKPAEQQPPAADEKAESETERANAQLLKRIPDEPTGLLKRKFKYQYGQRGRAAPSGPAW